MRRALVAVAMVVAVRGAAHADEWRDGCPAGNRSHYQRDPRLGASAETESALTDNRLVVGFEPSYHTSRGRVPRSANDDSIPRSTTYEVTGHLQQRLGLWGLTLGVSTSYLYHLEGSDQHRWPGSWLGSLAWRHDFEGERPLGDVAGTQGANVRRAVAIQAIGGVGVSPSDPDSRASYRREAALRAFDGYLLAPSVAGLLGEFRIEQVGCYAIFAHLRGGLLWTGVTDTGPGAVSLAGVEEPAFVVPITLAFGGYITDHVALIGEYGVAARRPKDIRHYVSTQRLRMVLDYADAWGNFGFHIDFASHVDGWVGGAYVAVNTP